jgi:hypothetical protein
MLKQGYWLFGFISISSVINQARASYERSFLLCETDDNDLTCFLLAQVTVIQLALLRHALRHAGFRYTVLPHQNPSPDCDLPMAGPGGAPKPVPLSPLSASLA